MSEKLPNNKIEESNHPFSEYHISDNIWIRRFCADTSSDELVWHKDHEDRLIRVLYGTGWSIQLEDNLPIILSESEWFYIPKMEWHRVIKGKTDLIIQLIRL